MLISGLTVMVAMAGMFLTGDAAFASFGLATILVVAIAVLGSLTVLPALLSKLGDKVDRLRVPFVGRLRRDDGEGRIWGAIVDRVLRRPALSAVLAGGLLLALAAPALQLRMRGSGPETLPQSLRGREDLRPDAAGVSGRRRSPANVVVKAPNVNAPAVRRRRSRGSSGGRSRAAACTSRSRSTSTRTRPSRTSPSRSTEREPTPPRTRPSPRLRETIVPQTVGAVPDVEAGRHRAGRPSGRTAPTR